MDSRLFSLVLFFFVFKVYAIDISYQMLPGQYVMEFIASDSEEIYPVNIRLTINDKGLVKYGYVNYPTYTCKAKVNNSKALKYRLIFRESMADGFDACTPERYEISINSKKLFEPSGSDYLSIRSLNEQDKVSFKLKKYRYTPTPYAKYRIKNKVKNIDSIMSLTDSSEIRRVIALLTHKPLILKANTRLGKLTAIENLAYKKLKTVKDFEGYIKQFPGSKKINDAKIKVYRKKSTPHNFYLAYKISRDNQDIKSLLGYFDSLNKLKLFVSTRELLNENSLIKERFVSYYRKEKTFDGYMNAFNILKQRDDIDSAYSIVVTTYRDNPVNDRLLSIFYDNYVLSVSNVDNFLLFLEKLSGVDKNKYYIKLMASNGFGENITMDNYFDSNEYKKILYRFKPKAILSGDADKVIETINYPGKKISFSLNASCKYFGQESKEGRLGLLEAMFSAATGVTHFYNIYECVPYKNDIEHIYNFEKRLLGNTKKYSLSWKYSVFSHSKKAYPSKSNNFDSGGSGQPYTCSFHCVGQLDSWRGEEKTAVVSAENESSAQDKVKIGYLPVCKKYPFYKGGGGSASVGSVSCQRN